MTDTDDLNSHQTAARGSPRGLVPVAAGAVAFGLCCGLPVLASFGAAGVIAGLGVGSWLAAAVASVVATIGVFRWRHQRECDAPPTTAQASRSFPVAVHEPVWEVRR